jgi:hypothetical protein
MVKLEDVTKNKWYKIAKYTRFGLDFSIFSFVYLSRCF